MKSGFSGKQSMKQKVIEPVLGICLLAMVVMAVKYGSIRVTGSGDAYIKETPVVVVDAGHGGTDPGKVGVDGSLEKDINLAVAERLKTYLEQDDVKVIMTRETDTGLYSETDSRKKMADMKKRCEIIEESGADLVVSIHQNSYHEESVSGDRYSITGIRQRERRWRRSCRTGLTMSWGTRTGDFRRRMPITTSFCM